MGLEKRSGMMEACTKVSTRMPVKKAKVSICGRMAIGILESGARIC